MYRLVRMSARLLQDLKTAELPTFAKDCLDSKHLELSKCIESSIATLDRIIISNNLNEVLEAIQRQNDDFINTIIWQIRNDHNLDRLSKMEFFEKFHDNALMGVLAKREEIEKIYFHHIDMLISRHQA
jgi:hypothetical protein